MRATLIEAIETLPEDQREVYLLREVANLSFKEIAEVTGVAENTAKSRMRYALDRLRTRLAAFEEYARALR
jgi:RNA polymerase sigma-70 factor (ECF subfamily)